MFSNPTVGVWYDPIDLSSMFQDSAGTTPVTAPGQPVGLRLDKSKNGIGSNGLYRRNLLTYTEDFLNGTWVKSGVLVSSTSVTDPDGGNTAATITASGGTGYFFYNTASNPTVPTIPSLWIRRRTGTGVIALRTNPTTGTDAPLTVTSTWQRVSVNSSAAGGPTQNCWVLRIQDSGDAVDIWHPQLETSATLTPYQRITSDWAATIPGNHAVQATAGARLTYGIEPKTGTRNQMLPSQPPVSGGGIWNPPTNSTVVASGEQVTITVTTTGIEAGYRTVPVFAINTQYTVSADFKPGTARYALLRNIGSNHNAWFDLQTAMVGTVSAGATATISLVSDGFYRCTITSTTGGTIVANLLDFRPASGDGLFSATGGQTISLRRAQLEIGPAATAYQKVVTAFEVTEAGVPTCHYCAYAGANSMATASIDFTATDKMSIFAGLRKSSDAGSYSMVAELSVASFSNNGAFAFMAPYTGATYGFESRGTAIAAAVSPATFAAPVNSLLTALGDISGDRATLRINGLQVAQSTSDQGTGNYGNYPLYFGRRAGSTLPFNGRDYGIIIAGKSASLQEISNAERLLANNTPSVTL